VKAAVEELPTAPDDGVARFAAAVGWHLYRFGAGLQRKDRWQEAGTTGPDRQREEYDEKACDEQESWLQGRPPQSLERRQPSGSAVTR
jgi:hypothetical protein